MIFIKDLGMRKLNPKAKNPRRYYEVKCPLCGRMEVIRSDIKKECCKDCLNIQRSKKAIDKALKLLDKGSKQCSKCKYELPLEAFGHKSQILSGFRSVCKDCRYLDEKETNRKYIASVRGKLSSANRQSKKRSLCKASNDNSITIDSLQELKIKQNHKCYHCGDELDYTTPRAVHLDHLIPISKGGKHILSNVAWSCKFCNLQKSNKTSNS